MMTHNIKINIWGWLIALLLCVSCEKDSIFTGRDAHIVSFSLTHDGTKYTAAITEDEIIITVPSNVNLNHSQVEYSLCENASIMPLPESINNWNEEHLFRVQAYNSDIFSSYKYTIRHSDIIDQDNVVLSTQSDVNAFAAKGINKIEGNLIIGSSHESQDPITDLSGLSALNQVSLNVVINNSYAGSTLEGLHMLEKVGGLYVGTETSKSSPCKKLSIDLPHLTQATNVVLYSDSIKSISLPSLKTASRLYINSIHLENIDLSMLEEVNGDFTLKGNNGGSALNASNNVLTIIDLPQLKTIHGNFTLENLWGVRNVQLTSLTAINGALDIKYIRTVKNISLPSLTQVDGAVNIQANDAMTHLSIPMLKKASSLNIASYNLYSINLLNIDMKALEDIDGTFTIKFFGGKTLEFPALKRIGGAMTLNTLQFLETLSIPSLSQCGAMTIQTCPSLKACDMSKIEETTSITLSGCASMNFSAPQKVTGNVSISGLIGDTIYGSAEIGGSLTISTTNEKLTIYNTKNIGAFSHTSGSALVEFSMPDLEEAGNINISSLNIATKYSMPHLNKVNGNLSIKGLYLAKDLDMSSLTTITGSFTFYGGTSKSYASRSTITNLNTFSALTSAKKVDIRYAGALVDYSGLKNVIPSLSSASSWKVQDCAYNPTYQDMIDGKFTNN